MKRMLSVTVVAAFAMAGAAEQVSEVDYDTSWVAAEKWTEVGNATLGSTVKVPTKVSASAANRTVVSRTETPTNVWIHAGTGTKNVTANDSFQVFQFAHPHFLVYSDRKLNGVLNSGGFYFSLGSVGNGLIGSPGTHLDVYNAEVRSGTKYLFTSETDNGWAIRLYRLSNWTASLKIQNTNSTVLDPLIEVHGGVFQPAAIIRTYSTAERPDFNVKKVTLQLAGGKFVPPVLGDGSDGPGSCLVITTAEGTASEMQLGATRVFPSSFGISPDSTVRVTGGGNGCDTDLFRVTGAFSDAGLLQIEEGAGFDLSDAASVDATSGAITVRTGAALYLGSATLASVGTLTAEAGARLVVAIDSSVGSHPDAIGAETVLPDSGKATLEIHAADWTAGASYQIGSSLAADTLDKLEVLISDDRPDEIYAIGDLRIENGSIAFTVRYAPTVATSAVWTGAAQDGDPENTANWCCTNSFDEEITTVPSSLTAVRIPSPITFSCPVGSVFNAASVAFDNPSVLAANVDWRGLGDFTAVLPAGQTVDLSGHKLFLSAPDATLTDEYVFTDSSSGVPGELHVTVETGTFVNGSAALTGNLKLVAEGAGIFRAVKTAQTYTGGTEVADGCRFQILASTTTGTHDGGADRYVGASGSTITVRSGCDFNLAGNYKMHIYNFVLDGGSLSHGGLSGDDYGLAQGTTSDYYDMIGNVTLTADSTYRPRYSLIQHGGTADLGGHTLFIDLNYSSKHMYWCDDAVNGTLRIGGGASTFHVNSWAVDARTVNLVTDGSPLHLAYDFSVSNYTVSATAPSKKNAGNGRIKVYGTFTPNSQNFFGPEMQDGSTVDLSAKTGAWVTTGGNTDTAVAAVFAADATVNVDLGAREDVADGLKVIDWEASGMPPSTTRFRIRLADEEQASKYRLVKKSDGLYAAPRGGLILLFK